MADSNMFTVFPTQKIRSALVDQEEQMGRLNKNVVDLIGACSAIFVQQLFVAAQTKKGGKGTPVTVQDLREIIETNKTTYSFLEGVWEGIAEDQDDQIAVPAAATKRKRATATKRTTTAKRPKLAPDQQDAVTKLVQEGASEKVTARSDFVPDEDDYD